MTKKRVHEIAKEHGLSSKELLEKLKAAGVEAKAAAETELGDGSQPAAHLGLDLSEVGVDGTGASESAAEQAPQAAEAPEPIAGQESAAEPTAEGQGA